MNWRTGFINQTRECGRGKVRLKLSTKDSEETRERRLNRGEQEGREWQKTGKDGEVVKIMKRRTYVASPHNLVEGPKEGRNFNMLTLGAIATRDSQIVRSN